MLIFSNLPANLLGGPSFLPTLLSIVFPLGVKIRNLRVEFTAGDTWRWVGQLTQITNIYNFYSTLLFSLKTPAYKQNLPSSQFFSICRRFVTKQNYKYSLSVFIAQPNAKCL